MFLLAYKSSKFYPFFVTLVDFGHALEPFLFCANRSSNF